MYHLIIADDEETIRNGLKSIVMKSNLGIKVEAMASDGKQTLEYVEKYQPELLLLDINMPILGGLDIIEKVREEAPLCKIIIISGYNDFSYAQKAVKYGVFDYLLKPVNIAALRTSLEKAIDEYQKRLWEVNCLNQLSVDRGEDSKNITKHALNYIRENYVSSDLSLALVAEKYNMSSSYLSRLIKQRSGLSFSDYLTKLRMEQAKQLLSSDQKHMIYEISSMVGYSSQHYFCRMFKEYTGVSPSDYRLTLLQGE